MPTYSKAGIQKLLLFCKKAGIEMVDIKFIDVPGIWRHITVPITEFTTATFEEGRGFDGSSVPGFQTIDESDMVVVPDPSTAFIDPFCEIPTLSIIGDPMDPGTGTPTEYDNNPRYIARKAMEYLRKTQIADTMYVGPEVEFFIFDDVRFGTDGHYSMYEIDSREGHWNNETFYEEGNTGFRPKHQGGYFPVPPIDTQQDLRSEMVKELQRAGVEIECHHHEVAGPGQAEIDMRYKPMIQQANQVMTYKYIVRNVAARYGKSVTYMPKPLFGQNGSGMHTHQSLWKNGKPLFYDAKGYAGLSQLALWYTGGILKHARSILAFGAPTTNSYKRLTPGYEAPVVLAYSKRNRSAAVRIPMYSHKPGAKRIEFRSADPLANPYLAFSAMLLAGLDGIKNKINPGKPHSSNLFELEGEEAARVRMVPSSLEEAMQALEEDHEYLLVGSVFQNTFIERYIADKREKEIDAVRLRPHPYEFSLYYTG